MIFRNPGTASPDWDYMMPGRLESLSPRTKRKDMIESHTDRSIPIERLVHVMLYVGLAIQSQPWLHAYMPGSTNLKNHHEKKGRTWSQAKLRYKLYNEPDFAVNYP